MSSNIQAAETANVCERQVERVANRDEAANHKSGKGFREVVNTVNKSTY